MSSGDSPTDEPAENRPKKGLWGLMGGEQAEEETEIESEPAADEPAGKGKGLWSMMPEEADEEEDSGDEIAAGEPVPSREEVLGAAAVEDEAVAEEPATTEADDTDEGNVRPAPRSAKAAAYLGVLSLPLAAMGLMGGIAFRLPGLAAGLMGVVLGLAAWHETKPRRTFKRKGRPAAAAGLLCGAAGLLTGPLVFSPLGEKWIDDRNQSVANSRLERLGSGLDEFHRGAGNFPIAILEDNNGTPLHGWMTSLLPHLGEDTLYRKIDRGLPFSDPANRGAFETRVTAFETAGMPFKRVGPGFAPAHFAGVGGGDTEADFGIFSRNPNEAVSLDDILDGKAQTLAVGTVSTGIQAWGTPGNFRDIGNGLNKSASGFGNYNKSGATFLHADGSVKFYSNKTDLRILRALSTRDGRDND